MTLQELISELQDLQTSYGPNIEVMTSSDYGDITHTEQLSGIRDIQLNVPIESAYSHSGLAFDSDDENEDREYDFDIEKGSGRQNQEAVIVLRYTN